MVFIKRIDHSRRGEANRHYEKHRREAENIGSAVAPHERQSLREREMQQRANREQFKALTVISDANRKRLKDTGKYEEAKKAFEKVRQSQS